MTLEEFDTFLTRLEQSFYDDSDSNARYKNNILILSLLSIYYKDGNLTDRELRDLQDTLASSDDSLNYFIYLAKQHSSYESILQYAKTLLEV